MLRKKIKISGCVWLCCLLTVATLARTDKYRAMWREDPATTMVIGWNQASGSNPSFHLDVLDHGQDVEEYAVIKKADHVVYAKGLKNHFVRLYGLKPNTIYYFLIQDSEGVSQRMSFKTAPGNAHTRLSLIAGGDSRNNREARQDANLLVSKLRPHCVMFGGDMTGGDTASEWAEWFDDWQLTITRDGRLTPIIVTRGNHESENQTLTDLFDVKSKDVYYALTLGGNLLRIYTLNSMIACGGSQRDWLERDLRAHPNIIWKAAQYHHSIRPHTGKKPDKLEQQKLWSSLFHHHRVNLVVESDAHVVKSTWPIRPSNESGSDDGFIRDDRTGTVYVGEGCWGAPLRPNNDNKKWTRNSGSFNQFKWIFVDENRIEIRTVRTDGSRKVGEVDPNNIFRTPIGLSIWNPSNGDVVVIPRMKAEPDHIHEPPQFEEVVVAHRKPMEMEHCSAALVGTDVAIKWKTLFESPGILFEVQRSINGDNIFKTIAETRGRGKPENHYQIPDQSFADLPPNTAVKYRLKRTLPDGHSNFYDLKEQLKSADNWELHPELKVDPATNMIKVEYQLERPSSVVILLLTPTMQAEKRLPLDNQIPGFYTQTLNLSNVPSGKYLLIVKAGKKVLKKHRVAKR